MCLDNNKLKVCYVYQDQYPWDVRVEKIATALAEECTEVHIISRNRDGLPNKEMISDNLYVHRLSKGVNRLTRSLLNFPAFFSPFWIKKIANIVKTYSADLIIVRDLPLSPAAYVAAKITNTPVLMDMAENYPALIKSTWTYRGPNPIDYVVRNPTFLKWLERLIIPLLDGILVVSRHSADRIQKILRNKSKVWVVSNTPILRDKNEQEKGATLANEIRSKSSFILLYVGFLEAHRGLEIPIKAVAQLAKTMPDILLVIVGKGTFGNKLKELVKQLGIEKNIVFTGWVSHREVVSFITNADICLIPHYVTEHTDTTFPNKIFDYMAQKKPIIVTQSKALSQIVERSNCGFIYQDNSPDSLSYVVNKLVDPNIRERLGLNGWRAVQEEFNWHYDKLRLFDAINQISIKKKR